MDDITPSQARNVRKIFENVAGTYERVNHILTLGLDILWRRRLARMAAAGGGDAWVDLCTGTGETAACLSRMPGGKAKIVAVDFSYPMLKVAKNKPGAARIAFVLSDIRTLPFPDESFDLATMSFATRNINLGGDALGRSFAEFNRILKPGGRFYTLETSQPPLVIRRLRDLYVRALVEFLGGRISGERASYAYLAGTIQGFHGPAELADIMRAAGFADVSFRRLLFGVAAIHRAAKR